jgi:type II secretory pathway component PulF
MMSLREIEVACGALGNQGQAGIPLSESVRRMARIQVKYKGLWGDVAFGVSEGKRFSEFFDEVCPEAIVNAVKAGELSGKLYEVFIRIEETTALQSEIRGLLYKLISPVLLVLGGVVLFFGFMLEVLPQLAKSLGSGSKGLVFEVSQWMSEFFTENWLVCVSSLCVFLCLIFFWLRDEENRALILGFLLSIPVLGDALKNIYFGLWAYYMALMDASGSIALVDELTLTLDILPIPLRAGVRLMADEVVSRGIANSADGEKQDDDDPRRGWPFYITTAFIVAEQTGDLNKSLLKAAPIMIKDGTKLLTFSLKIANNLALVLAGVMITVPLVAYYLQLAASLTGALSGR